MRLLRTTAFFVCVVFYGSASALPLPAAESARLTRDQLVDSLARDVAAHFNLEGDLRLELLRAWSPPARAAGTWAVDILEYPAVPASSMLLRCRVLADAVEVAETTFVVRATLFRDVWVTRQPLTVNATFDPAQLDVRRVDTLRERDAIPVTVGDRSYIFARALSAGRLLTWHDISRRPLVRKGDLVEVSAADGLLTVTIKALALESGAKGDTVTVRNPDSRKDFVATVINENRVQVRF